MDEKHIPAGITGFFTAEEARAYHLIPVERNAGELKCYGKKGCCYDSVREEIAVVRGVKLQVEVLPEDGFERLMRQCYRHGGAIADMSDDDVGSSDFLSRLILEAYHCYASDLHF